MQKGEAQAALSAHRTPPFKDLAASVAGPSKPCSLEATATLAYASVTRQLITSSVTKCGFEWVDRRDHRARADCNRGETRLQSLQQRILAPNPPHENELRFHQLKHRT